MAAGDYKKPRPGRAAPNRARRRNARDQGMASGSGSRYNRREHDKGRRPPGRDQNNPGSHRNRP